MPNRREISSPLPALAPESNLGSCLSKVLSAMIVYLALAFGAIPSLSAQETPQPQLPTQASPSPAAKPPADQAPSAPAPSANPLAFYSFLQSKSIVFPDIALSTERLST